MYAVIIAGGRGTRFWPASRKDQPKQLLNIIGENSMLQMTVDRLRKTKNVEDIFIITGKHLEAKIKKTISGVDLKNIITEPSGKNTAPAIGLAALYIKQKRSDAVMGVFPADHLIVGAQKFSKSVRSAIQIATKKQTLVTIGIKPNYPATGYGYIQFNKKSPDSHLNAFPVKTFAEKPHEKLAARFLKSGDFVAIENVGAYGFVLASNYNTRPKIDEYIISNSKVNKIRDRETINQILENELKFL